MKILILVLLGACATEQSIERKIELRPDKDQMIQLGSSMRFASAAYILGCMEAEEAHAKPVPKGTHDICRKRVAVFMQKNVFEIYDQDGKGGTINPPAQDAPKPQNK